MMERMLAKMQIKDERVVLGPKPGEDAAVLDYGDRFLVAKTDPVTLATDQIGWYAVHVNANDVACTGATPRWFLATLLVPEAFTEGEVEAVFDQVLAACDSLGVSLVGWRGPQRGDRGTFQAIRNWMHVRGSGKRCNMVHTGGAQDGDSIVVTKGIAMVGGRHGPPGHGPPGQGGSRGRS